MNYFLPLRKYFRLYTEIVDILNNLKKKNAGTFPYVILIKRGNGAGLLWGER